MSYIHRFNVNHYRPCENLKNLFEELVIQPYNNHPSTQAWKTEVINKEEEYHRKTILDRGRTDFDMPFNGLSPEDKVLLYCVYYMPMHLYSSYHVFLNHLPPISERVIFIDFGCGPLTSGIAFWATSSHMDITYIGIDRSEAMLKKARDINRNGLFQNTHRPFFEKEHFLKDFVQLPLYLESVEIGDPNNALIILNFCYILASYTFDDNENLDSLIGVINRVVNEYEKYKICAVYQNPVRTEFQENWRYLKSWVIRPDSIFALSDLSEQGSTKKGQLRYETILEGMRPTTVSYDSFNNFSFKNNSD